MGFRYVILGAGRQGVAIAYDLARTFAADRVTLADADHAVAARAAARVESLLATDSCELEARRCDVERPADVAAAIAGAHVAVSAVPYRFNASLTDAAIAAGASFCDLGGNTDVVREQLRRHEAAAAAGVSVVPDCGLAPGLGNLLAAYGVSLLDEPEHVHVRCGGLPDRRVGPLGYKLVFNFGGLINEYSGFGEFLRDGQAARIPALTEIENISFPPPVGSCEAAVTSGGTSTCPETFRGRLRSYDYKTVRYPGHWELIRLMFAAGLFEREETIAESAPRDFTRRRLAERLGPDPAAAAPKEPPDGEVKRGDLSKLRGALADMGFNDTEPAIAGLTPYEFSRRCFERNLSFPDVYDLVVLRVAVAGEARGERRSLQFDLLDRHDSRTGFSAMERTTAFPTALVAYMQARGAVSPGARPAELAVPLADYVRELPQHDIRVRETA